MNRFEIAVFTILFLAICLLAAEMYIFKYGMESCKHELAQLKEETGE